MVYIHKYAVDIVIGILKCFKFSLWTADVGLTHIHLTSNVTSTGRPSRPTYYRPTSNIPVDAKRMWPNLRSYIYSKGILLVTGSTPH